MSRIEDLALELRNYEIDLREAERAYERAEDEGQRQVADAWRGWYRQQVDRVRTALAAARRAHLGQLVAADY